MNPLTPQEVANIMTRVAQGTATPSDFAALTRVAASARNLLTGAWKDFEKEVGNLLMENGEMLISVIHSGSLSATGKSKNSAACDSVEIESGGDKYFVSAKIVVETAKERESRLQAAKDASKEAARLKKEEKEEKEKS